MTTLPASSGRPVTAPADAGRTGVASSGPGGDVPRVVSSRTAEDGVALLGSIVGSWALVFVAYDRLLPFSGVVGFVVCWFVVFLLVYAIVSAISQPRPVVAVASTVVYTLAKGWAAQHHLNFFTKSMNGIPPTAPLNQGGILNAIVGSLEMVGMAVVVSFPLGVGTAVYISEVGGRFARVVRTVVEAMTALPDILAGLFIFAILVLRLGVQIGGFATSMALTVMMLPIIARASEVVLRVVPNGLREASLALGATRWRTVWRVVLPTARAGLGTALILGIARTIGETAPVLITSGASTFLNWDPFHEPMNSLPLYIYSAFSSGERLYAAREWGAASVLLEIVLILFIITRLLARTRSAPR
jgi:phosphate transport system permease protein